MFKKSREWKDRVEKPILDFYLEIIFVSYCVL
jgi:hypothetical protein